MYQVHTSRKTVFCRFNQYSNKTALRKNEIKSEKNGGWDAKTADVEEKYLGGKKQKQIHRRVSTTF